MDDIICPLCKKRVVIRYDGLVGSHNIGWQQPDASGISLPIRCPGSLKRHEKPAAS